MADPSELAHLSHLEAREAAAACARAVALVVGGEGEVLDPLLYRTEDNRWVCDVKVRFDVGRVRRDG